MYTEVDCISQKDQLPYLPVIFACTLHIRNEGMGSYGGRYQEMLTSLRFLFEIGTVVW